MQLLALPPLPPQPNVDDVKLKRFKLDVLLREHPEQWPAVYDRCKRDFFFWAEMFCFAYNEHTTGGNKIIPLALYQFQRMMAGTIIENVWRVLETDYERWNAGSDKARKMTATFTALLVCQWFAQFHGISTVITTKTKDDVDITEDMNTPFERLRFQIERQPKHLLPPSFNIDNKETYKKRLINFGNGGQLTGIAPTGNAMRQARALIWLGDEFAFLKKPKDEEVWEGSSGTVRIRLIFSTPNGTDCKFHYLIYPDDLEDEKDAVQFHTFELDWFKHPDYAEGLRRLPDGTLTSHFMEALKANEKPATIAKEYLRDHGDSAGGKVYFMFAKYLSGRDILEPDQETKVIYRSWDPGGHFAVGIGQKNEDNQLLCLKEFYRDREKTAKNTTVLRAIAEEVINWTEEHYQGWDIVDIGDPYGAQINGDDDKESTFSKLFTIYQIRVMSAFVKKMPTHTRRSKGIEIIRDLMVSAVKKPDGTEQPQLLIHRTRCSRTMKAFSDKYRYEMLDGVPTDEIARNHPYNDIADVWRYMAIKLFDNNKGGGEGRPTIAKNEPTSMRRTGGGMRRTERRYA